MNHKRYWLFAGYSRWDKRGGYDDLQGSFDDLVDALRFLATSDHRWGWYQILDSDNMKIVESWDG